MMERDADEKARVAATLMRMALALLDRIGEGLATARLQHAIDTLRAPREVDRCLTMANSQGATKRTGSSWRA